MKADDGLGRRLAVFRRRRGLSQAALAGLVGRSESWLSQVERGVRSVDRTSVLLDLARILHVDVESLTGRAWQFSPNGTVVANGLAELRATLTSYNGLLGRRAVEPVRLVDSRAAVAELHRTYQAARYDDVMAALPPVLASLESRDFAFSHGETEQSEGVGGSVSVVLGGLGDVLPAGGVGEADGLPGPATDPTSWPSCATS